MFTNYLKIAFRSMLRQKTYSLINVFGLMIGMTACILIVLWVVDETSYDRFHAKGDRIYRATWNAQYGNNEWNIPLVPVPLGPTLEQQFPEVESVVRFRQGGFTLRQGNNFTREDNVLFTDESFFDVFTTDFVAGEKATALHDPEAVVMTNESAVKYFGSENPVGKTLEMNDGSRFRVTAVVKRFPSQSHFHFDFLRPLASLPLIERRKEQWGSATVYTYVLLRENQSGPALAAKLDDYVQKNIIGRDFDGTKNFSRFPLAPMSDIHLKSHLRYELEPNGDIAYVYIFSLIAFFILFLACINFVNLATARAMKRAREVGMRKVLGSVRTQLVRQFFSEAFAYVFVATLGALALIELLLPGFNGFSGKELSSGFFASPPSLLVLLAFILIVTALAGAYPALVLSSFRPVEVLKSGSGGLSGKGTLRKTLVVIQFSISIVLIVGTLVVQKQLQYVQNKNLGYDKDQVMVVHSASALGSRSVLFRQRLAAEPAVVDAAAAQFLPGQIFDSTVFTLEQPANYENTSVTYDMVDPEFADVLKLNVVQGRFFSPSMPTDSSAFVINQSAAKTFGWNEPLGKTLSMGGGFVQGPVIGVVEDFHFESLHHEMKPMILMFNRWRVDNIAVRIRESQMEEGIASAQKLWKEMVADVPFNFSFLDQDYQRLYDSEQRVEKVFVTFSFLAVVIACLGLFGFASYATGQRTREIGIRKTLGATAPGIVTLLLKEFGGLVLISFAVAIPLAYYSMDRWLQDFAYRTSVGWEVFAFAGLITAAVSLLSVGAQSLRASLTNPVEALRHE